MTPRAGQSLGGRPVTETVTPVNVGNQPHCDNGEGVATASPLPSRMKAWRTLEQRAAVRYTDSGILTTLSPALKVLGYCHSSASADWLNLLFVQSRNQTVILGPTSQRACGVGGSIKPRVERSGTLGGVRK